MNNGSVGMELGPRFRMPGVVYPPAQDQQRYVDAGLLGRETLIEAYMATHARWRDRPALVGPEGDFTHGQLDEITDRVASAFLDLGLKPLDRVVFQVPNCNELIFGWLGCMKAGLIPVCTLVSHREREISFLARHSAARLHFVQGDDPKYDHVELARRMQAEATTLEHIVVARGPARDGALSLKALWEAQDPVRARERVLSIERDPFQVVLFHLSGGTTGVPKIITRFQAEYLYNMRAVAQWNGYTEEDLFSCPMPFMHNANMVAFQGPTLLVGGAIALSPSPDPDAVRQLLQRYRPTRMIMGGPAFVKMAPLLEKNRDASKAFFAQPLAAQQASPMAGKLIDFSRARAVYSTNGAKAIEAAMGIPTFHLFGMTEGVISFTRPEDPLEARERSVGRPVSPLDRIKILKPGTEEELPEGETGEPAFKGPYTTHGYYDAPDRNKEAFTSDGYYRSGDLMSCRRIDGKLYYFFEGRIKDVVDRGGEKINAGEVEEALMTHPAIEGCAVVGLKDPALGERMCACLVLRDGHKAPSVAELGQFLQAYGLAKFKWPERIEVLPVLPITHVGKLDKVLLRKQFDKSLAA